MAAASRRQKVESDPDIAVVTALPGALVNRSLMQIAIALYPKHREKDALVAALRVAIMGSPMLIEKAIEYVVHHVVGAVPSAIRSDIGDINNVQAFKTVGRSERSGARYLDALSTALTLFDVVLPFVDVTLGNATAGNLASVVEGYEGRATVSQSRAKAYRHLQSMLRRSNKSTVSEAFSVSEVKKILGNVESAE